MTSAPPGWYPDPAAVNTMRYWDGRSWTSQSAPMMAPQPVVIAASSGNNHLIHLILTLVTCGLWAPVWLLIAVFESRGPSQTPLPRWAGAVAVAAVVLIVVAMALSSVTQG